MPVRTKILEDCTGEFQFECEVDEQKEIEVLEQFYELWDCPTMRGVILHYGSWCIPVYDPISTKWVEEQIDDLNSYHRPVLKQYRVAEFKMIKSNR